MSSFTRAPIYIYGSSYHEGERYSAHPIGVAENEKRLREFGVDPKRISRVSDPSALKAILDTQEKSILILGGGYAPFLTRELEELQGTIQGAVEGGRLRVWGQCAGAMAVCQKFSVPSRSAARAPQLKQLSLLPLLADADVYPIEKEEFANRKIVSLLSADHKGFKSYWYRGAHFKRLSEARGSKMEIFPLTYYQGTASGDAAQKPVETVCGIHPSGAVVVASGAHAEIADVEMTREQMVACQQLRFDAQRIKHLKSVYELLGIIPKQFEARRVVHLEPKGAAPFVLKRVESIAQRHFTSPVMSTRREGMGGQPLVREKPFFSSSVLLHSRKMIRL